MKDIFVIGTGKGVILDQLLEEDTSKATLTLSKLAKIVQAKESAHTAMETSEFGSTIKLEDGVHYQLEISARGEPNQ